MRSEHMPNSKGTGYLIVTLFVGLLVGSGIGRALELLIPGENIVEKALLSTIWEYGTGAVSLNLIVLSFDLALSLHINVIGILGMLAGWYYYKYSY